MRLRQGRRKREDDRNRETEGQIGRERTTEIWTRGETDGAQILRET